MVKLSHINNKHTIYIYSLLLSMSFTFINTNLLSQDKTKKKSLVKLSGSLGVFYDIYEYSEKNYPTFRARHPDNILRFNANATIRVGKYFSLPFSVNVTNQKVIYNLPNVPKENIIDYVQNPQNNISINPEYKWFKAYLGTHTPNYSSFTTGDINIFGAGVDINPGKFIFSANYGISQRAVEADSLFNIFGVYKQKILSSRIGVGKINGPKFTLNFVKVKDDINSIAPSPYNVEPIEGITISPLLQLKFGKKIFFKTETAASLHTSDLLNQYDIDSDIVSAFNKLIEINASSNLDYSHNTSLEWRSQKFSLGGEVKYIGPGFIPAGYRNIEQDIIDYKINSGLRLFKGKTSISGMFGIRTNNLQNTDLQSTRRVIANANVFSQMTEAFSINLSYSNFGFNNGIIDNALRIEMINNSFSLIPTYRFKTAKANHNINVGGTFNSFDQFDIVSTKFISTKSTSFTTNYNMTLKDKPLNVGFLGMYLKNVTPINELKMLNYGGSLGYKMFKKKVTPSLSANFGHIYQDEFTPDFRLSLSFRVKYKITKKLLFNCTYKFTNYTYGSVKPDAIINQNKIQLSLLQKF